MFSSTIAKSLENLLSIFPSLCISKNCMVDPIIFSKITLCNLTDAIVLKMKNKNALPNVNSDAIIVIVVYRFNVKVCRCRTIW